MVDTGHCDIMAELEPITATVNTKIVREARKNRTRLDMYLEICSKKESGYSLIIKDNGRIHE